MSGEALKGHLDLLLLAVLADRPAHGSAIIDSLRARSGSAFDLPEGTVYPALHRLERNALLDNYWSQDPPRRRRIYQLTARGPEVLVERRQEWEQFSRAVRATLSV